jgi:hypothetical protein
MVIDQGGSFFFRSLGVTSDCLALGRYGFGRGFESLTLSSNRFRSSLLSL